MLFLERGGNDTFVGFHVFLVSPTCSMLTKLQYLYILITYLMDIYNHLESSLWLDIVKVLPHLPLKLLLHSGHEARPENNWSQLLKSWGKQQKNNWSQTGAPNWAPMHICWIVKKTKKVDSIHRIINCWKEKRKLI